MNESVNRILEIAKGWNHKSVYGIINCPKETCAFFVRYVFKEALHEAGKMLVANTRPYYQEHGIRQLDTNENFADGLAGNEIGMRIATNQMMPGDLLFFRDTYRGDFPAGSITHVGICVGQGGLMADSSGGSCHIRNHAHYFPGLLVEVRRPKCLDLGTSAISTGTGITYNHGQVNARSNGARKNQQEIKIQYGQPAQALSFNVGGSQYTLPKSGVLHVLVDGKPLSFFKYVTVDIGLGGHNQRIKLFYHDGKTRAYLNGQETSNLEIIARFSGALHIWVNKKEIKPTSMNIGIS